MGTVTEAPACSYRSAGQMAHAVSFGRALTAVIGKCLGADWTSLDVSGQKTRDVECMSVARRLWMMEPRQTYGGPSSRTIPLHLLSIAHTAGHKHQ